MLPVDVLTSETATRLNATPTQVLAALNEVLLPGLLVDIVDVKGRMHVRKLTSEQRIRAQRESALNADEKLIYQAIERAKTKGIWIKELKKETSLHKNVLEKGIRRLETLSLIKTFKSQAVRNRKYYILFDLEPDTDECTFYTNGDLDLQATQVVKAKLIELVTARLSLSASQCEAELNAAQVLRQPLSSSDVAVLLRACTLSGELCMTSADPPTYCAASPLIPPSARADAPAVDIFADAPCLRCPLTSVCGQGNVISPDTCDYLKSWLAW